MGSTGKGTELHNSGEGGWLCRITSDQSHHGRSFKDTLQKGPEQECLGPTSTIKEKSTPGCVDEGGGGGHKHLKAAGVP